MQPYTHDGDPPETPSHRAERWSRRDVYAILGLLTGALALAVGSKVYVIVQDNSRLDAALNNRTAEIARLREDVTALKAQLSSRATTSPEAQAKPIQPLPQDTTEVAVAATEPAHVASSPRGGEENRPTPAIEDVTAGKYEGDLAPCEQRHLCLKRSDGTIIRTKVGDGYKWQMWSWKRNIEIEYLAEGFNDGEPVRFEVADGYLRRLVLFDK